MKCEQRKVIENNRYKFSLHNLELLNMNMYIYIWTRSEEVNVTTYRCTHTTLTQKVKVKILCIGPDCFQEFEAPRISRQLAHEGGKVVSPTHRPPLPPRKYSWNSFLLEAESTQAGRICQTLNTKVGHIWSTGNIRQKKLPSFWPGSAEERRSVV
jgi:hypothetical protein